MRLEDIIAQWEREAEKGRDITRPANALLWRWPDDFQIVESLAMNGPKALGRAMEAHLLWLSTLRGRETPAECQARRLIGVAGIHTNRRGTPGPLPERLAWISGRYLFDSEAIEARVRALEPGRSTAEAAILAVAEVLEAWWQTPEYEDEIRAEREALEADDEAHRRRWQRSAETQGAR